MGAGIERIVLGEVLHALVNVAVAAIARIVAIDNAMIFTLGSKETVVAERLHWVEIEHKHQVASHESKHLVTIIMPYLYNRFILEVTHALHHFNHLAVKVTQPMIA